MKKLLLILTVALSLSCAAQTQPDNAANNTFALHYLGYSNYIVGGYYAGIENFTTETIDVLVKWHDGQIVVTVEPGQYVVFYMPAERYTINSKIKATVINPARSVLICQVKGTYYN